jgi:hypothetical protein
MRRIFRPVGLLVVAVAATALPADRGRAATCALPNEHAALSTRVLQSDLMVAALTCGERNSYNSFVTKFEAELVAHGKALRQYFTRAHGKGGRSEVNRFVTRLANKASARSIAQGSRAFCTAASSLFKEILGIESADLRTFVAQRPHAGDHGIRSCAVKASRAEPQ